MKDTPDYKYGEYDAKIAALKEDVGELKICNTAQHNDIINQIRKLGEAIDGLRSDMGIMKGKSSAYGAVAGFLAGIIIPIINLFKNN